MNFLDHLKIKPYKLSDFKDKPLASIAKMLSDTPYIERLWQKGDLVKWHDTKWKLVDKICKKLGAYK